MADFKNLKTRIVLTHDDYSNLKAKHLKNGEVILAKVGEITEGNVIQPVFMMKVGTAEETKTVAELPWLMAPAADVHGWAKKQNLDVVDVPTLPISKIEGLQDALDALAAEDERLAGLITGLTNTKADKVTGATAGNFAGLDANGDLTDSGKKAADFAEAGHNHKASSLTDFDADVKAVVNTMGLGTNDTIKALSDRMDAAETDIDSLEANKVDNTAYNEKVAALEKADTDEAAARELLAGRVSTLEADATTKTYVDTELAKKADKATYEAKVAELEAADSALDTAVKKAQSDIDTFMGVVESDTEAIDTLKEVIDLIEAGDDVATGLLSDVANLKAADVTLQANIDKKANQTDLDALATEVGHDLIPGYQDDCSWVDEVPATGLYAKIEDISEDVEKRITYLSTGFSEGCDTFGIYSYINSADETLRNSIQQVSDRVGHAAGNYDCGSFEATGVYAYIDNANNELSLKIENGLAEIEAQIGNPSAEYDCGTFEATGLYAYVEGVDNKLDSKIDNEVSALSDRIERVASVATSSIQDINVGDGLKITYEEKYCDATDYTKPTISIDEEVVFILDGGTASNLD